MPELRERKCEPCRGDTPRLNSDESTRLLGELAGWSIEQQRLVKTLEFSDFRAAMSFVNAMAEVAEQEGHHPDFCVHWNRVDVTLWTHAIDGLSENDFILASKLDRLLSHS